MKCWASVLGGCAGGQSKEHYVSKGLYDGDVIASGLPWAEGEPLTLPIKGMCANILCKHHNESLSAIDGEAVRFKDFIVETIEQLAKGVESVPARYGEVDATKIIRWLCKTICNLTCLRKQTPDRMFVRRAFDVPQSPVYVYIHKESYPSDNIDITNFRFWPWGVDLKNGGKASVYIFRFAALEWLIAPFALTKGECDELGCLTQGKHWFKAQPLGEDTTIPLGGRAGDGLVSWKHELLLRFPKKRRHSRRT